MNSLFDLAGAILFFVYRVVVFPLLVLLYLILGLVKLHQYLVLSINKYQRQIRRRPSVYKSPSFGFHFKRPNLRSLTRYPMQLTTGMERLFIHIRHFRPQDKRD
jgi:hypothetical protein